MKELLSECVTALESVNGLVVKSEGVDCQFDELIEKLQKEIINYEKSIEDYYNEWEKLIHLLTKTTKDLYNLKNQIFEKEQEIIKDTNFKELYGQNNKDVRQAHLNKEIGFMYDAKKDLEVDKTYLTNRIEYLRSYMSMQRAFIDCGAITYD